MKKEIPLISLAELLIFFYIPSFINLSPNRPYYLDPNNYFTRSPFALCYGDTGIYELIPKNGYVPFTNHLLGGVEWELLAVLLVSNLLLWRHLSRHKTPQLTTPAVFFHSGIVLYFFFMYTSYVFTYTSRNNSYFYYYYNEIPLHYFMDEINLVPIGYALLFYIAYIKIKIELEPTPIRAIFVNIWKDKLLFGTVLIYLLPFFTFYLAILSDGTGIFFYSKSVLEFYYSPFHWLVFWYTVLFLVVIFSGIIQAFFHIFLQPRYKQYFSLGNVFVFYMMHILFWNFKGNYEMNDYLMSLYYPSGKFVYIYVVYLPWTNFIVMCWLGIQLLIKVIDFVVARFRQPTQVVDALSSQVDSLYPDA